MSIPVELGALGDTLEGFPWGFLVTVGDDHVAHSLAVPTVWRDGALHIDAGRSTRANATARPATTMVFPGVDGRAYSLILDGRVEVREDAVVFTPTNAVLHRPALR